LLLPLVALIVARLCCNFTLDNHHPATNPRGSVLFSRR
jgi:hypothetical protein